MGGGGVFGPEPTSAVSYDAATQLHHTGHSSIVQHFRWVKVGRADFFAVRPFSANSF
jgi:hypothetical protein